ncbi:MAG: hypothetical protein FWG87_03285 [Defluviitaleaceae bacterium]|nr:hypothetical protein [Defluviitaleaceae bacterium]
MHDYQFGSDNVPSIWYVATSGRTSPPPTVTVMPNTRMAKHHAKRTNGKICTVFVGDGFIRPEVSSLCVNGRCPPRPPPHVRQFGTDNVPSIWYVTTSGRTGSACGVV